MIIFISKDLLFVGAVKGAAQRLARELRVVRSLPETWTEDSVEIVVVDLADHDTSPSEIAARARSLFPQVRLLAFGPHVNVASFRAAEEAGFDQVLTRGEFSRNPYKYLELLLPQ